MRRYNKPNHFLEIYRELFKPFKKKKGRILELGIQDGGSLELWAEWLPGFQVIGVDVHDCKEIDTDRITTLLLDQRDPRIAEYGKFDIIIDDGGHKMTEQIGSFKLLFPELKKNGIYIIEDLNSSYWDEFIDQQPTAKEFLIDLVDSVNREAWDHISRCHLDKKDFYEINSISFYKYLCVIRK